MVTVPGLSPGVVPRRWNQASSTASRTRYERGVDGLPTSRLREATTSLITHFDTQAQAHAPAPRVECRFDDDGDDGGHANRAALVFQSPKDLVNCFEALENDGRLDIVAVSNGFLASLKTQELADENTKPTLAPVWKSTNELAGENVASMA